MINEHALTIHYEK